MENNFSSKIKDLSNSELRKYIENQNQYKKEAVQAAIWELEKRGEQIEEAYKVKEEVIIEEEKEEGSVPSYLDIPVNTVKPGIRFVHFLIDGFIIETFLYSLNLFPSIEIANFFGLVFYPFYYIFFEYHFQWTPGKLISNTIVIDRNGERPEFKIIILRTFARFIPFEQISCLGQNSWGWHDRLTKTYVIDKDNLDLLREKRQLSPIKLEPLKLSLIAYFLIGGFVSIIIFSNLITKKINSESEVEMQQWIKTIDQRDYNTIRGEWITNNNELQNLNFVSSETVISIKEGFSNRTLNYKIENRALKIFSPAISIEYIIVQISSNQMQLIDPKDPMNQITWLKK